MEYQIIRSNRKSFSIQIRGTDLLVRAPRRATDEQTQAVVLQHKGGKDMFDPNLEIGQILKNKDIVDIFKCGNMGGMRRSRTTNTLVLISVYTKGIYHD